MAFNQNKLKELRKAACLSREDLVFNLRSKGLDISVQKWMRWETGKYVPDANDLDFIAKYFKKSPLYFFN